jgi:hypothetical protein
MTNRKWLILAAVAASGLLPFHHIADQDRSRFCLTRALIRAHIAVGPCIASSVDKSRYNGRLYSNKAPGMSVAAIPSYAVAAAIGGERDDGLPSGRWIWFLRLMTAGVSFIGLSLVLWTLGERLQAGAGAATAVAGTVAMPLLAFAATAYDQVPAAALLLASFAAAWRGKALAAGLAAGAAFFVEYQSGVAWAILLVYVALRGARPAARYLAGSMPFLVALGAYDWAAFGAPWHNPLDYSHETRHHTGLLGVHLPTWHGLHLVFVGEKGLLVTTPLVLMGAAGLVLMLKRYRWESVACASIAAAYVLAEAGYFDPYAGFSPGPRYLLPGLPFLAVGLPFAFERWRRLTWTLVLVSGVASVAVTLTWALGSNDYSGTIWAQLGHALTERGHARLVSFVAPTVLPVADPKLVDVLLVGGAAASAVLLALIYRPPTRTPTRRRHLVLGRRRHVRDAAGTPL